MWINVKTVTVVNVCVCVRPALLNRTPLSESLTFVLVEQRGAVVQHLVVLTLDQFTLAVVQQQRRDH